MILTSRRGLAEKAKLLREYGWREPNVSSLNGYNSRLDELQAAVLRVKRDHLDNNNQFRIQLARQNSEQLQGLVEAPVERDNCRHVFHLYVVQSNQRDRLLRHLNKQDIGALIHYPTPVHLQPIENSGPHRLPMTEQVCRQILSLPLYSEMQTKDVLMVSEAVRQFLRSLIETRAS